MQEVELLEDVLERYGIVIDWGLDESAAAPESRVDSEALWRDVVRAGADPRTELLAASHEQLGSGTTLPLAMRLGDIRGEKGQVEAALKAYELALLEEDDPARLCELAYLLLQRCRVDKLPLCDKDFEGWVRCGSETLSISSYLIAPDNPGPEFADKAALLRLAIRAFGLGYARCVEGYLAEEVPAGNWWREFVALDGLRVAFLEDDNLDGLEAAIREFYARLADFDEQALEMSPDDILDPFAANFREADGYLRGRRKVPPVRPDALRPRHLAAAEDTLQREHGDRCLQLPSKVRWLLTEGQFQQFLLRGTDADWAAVANWYGRAVEALLRRRLGGKLDAQGLHSRFNDGHPYARAGIGDFVRLFELPRFAELGPLVGISQAEASMMAELAPDLETVASFRNLADHGEERTPPARGLKLRALLLGVEGRGGLLWKINSLRSAH